MSFVIKELSYILPNREILFQHISFSLKSKQKVSLIGNNGSGKSTLLKIVSGKFPFSEGEMIFDEKPYYIPQHFGQYNHLTIAQALEIEHKRIALKNILEGDASVENFNILNDDWSINERAVSALKDWNLEHFSFDQSMGTLSGGEKTKVFLAGISVHSPKIILMDEPTNHLDSESRSRLYQLIEKTTSTLLIVSHDRTLLNLLSPTLELQKDRIELYGGNYDFYISEKEKKINAIQNQLAENEKELKKAKKIAIETIERQNKHSVRGEKLSAKKGLSRISMGNLQRKSESSTAKLKDIHHSKIEHISESLSDIKEKAAQIRKLKLDIGNTGLHEGKILVEAKELNFAYNKNYLWKNHLNFQIRSGEVFVVQGRNGSGKTTLINLITGNLNASQGMIKTNDLNFIAIDQDYSMIKNQYSVLEQISKYNSRKLLDHEIKILLNRFLFSYDTWNKPCQSLSGGEKMRLLLCCLQAENKAPDLLILDEPTNNLDIQSMEILTSAIQSYQGTLLLISHDKYFVQEVVCKRITSEINYINLSRAE
ncbi:MAG: ATP-binding cassette domain-containing protein [Dysgonamonadaceae bacterium]|jgi:ATPase subunit of ABC transporter with duplicated ATPase domains|nr:ATP-binding cassette domain-containing protein [Dysgonamonadaceae bacterium]